VLPDPTSFALRRCGDSGNGSSSCTTGRVANLVEAIEAHASKGSEANTVVQRFNNLGASQQQNLVNFLRSL
jgi:hypothetical protein